MKMKVMMVNNYCNTTDNIAENLILNYTICFIHAHLIPGSRLETPR